MIEELKAGEHIMLRINWETGRVEGPLAEHFLRALFLEQEAIEARRPRGRLER